MRRAAFVWVYWPVAFSGSHLGLQTRASCSSGSRAPHGGSGSQGRQHGRGGVRGSSVSSSLGLSRRGAQRLYTSVHHQHFKEGM